MSAKARWFEWRFRGVVVLDAVYERALGTWLGQLCGDALGSQVEGASALTLAHEFPKGMRQMGPSPVWQTIAGQPTDDSELAMELAYALIETFPRFDGDVVARHYDDWMQSTPFSLGRTMQRALRGAGDEPSAAAMTARADPLSQANGALMRQSPLGIWGAGQSLSTVIAAAAADTALTHPHPVCQESSQVWTATVAQVIAQGLGPEAAHRWALQYHRDHGREPTVARALAAASDTLPPLSPHPGHVIVALHNAFYQVLHQAGLEEVIVGSVMLGGDTDTNAAIAGALAGAVYGAAQVPRHWRSALCACQPDVTRSTRHPRPPRYWPGPSLRIVAALIGRPR